jgi:class 3 adenylate cyclase
MAIERMLLLIADIGGYTRFMKVHRLSLAHAQNVVAQLLEAVIDGSEGLFEVAKLEGDAVFLYARVPNGREPDLAVFAHKVREIREAFLSKMQDLKVNRACSCDGCVQADQLKLKFVSHVGEAAFQKVRRFVELAGVDVILVHRMLKNSVPVGEYVLMTGPIHDGLAPALQDMAKQVQEDFEGLGETRTHYIDLNDMALVTLPELKPSLWRKAVLLLRANWRSIPYLLGFKKPCEGFRHIDPHVGGLLPEGVSQEPLGEGVRQ